MDKIEHLRIELRNMNFCVWRQDFKDNGGDHSYVQTLFLWIFIFWPGKGRGNQNTFYFKKNILITVGRVEEISCFKDHQDNYYPIIDSVLQYQIKLYWFQHFPYCKLNYYTDHLKYVYSLCSGNSGVTICVHRL